MLKKLKQHYLDSATVLSNEVIKVILKKQDYLFAIQNIEQIDYYFEYFINKLIEIYSDIDKRYNKTKDYSGSIIKDELSIYNEIKKINVSITSEKSSFQKLKLNRIKKYKKMINKWRRLTILIDEMPKVIDWYKTYNKEYDSKEIEDKLKESQIFKSSFSYYEEYGNRNSKRIRELDK